MSDPAPSPAPMHLTPNERVLRSVLHHVNTGNYRIIYNNTPAIVPMFDPATPFEPSAPQSSKPTPYNRQYLLRHTKSNTDVLILKPTIINTILNCELVAPDGGTLTPLGHTELNRLNAIYRAEAPVNV